MPIQITIDEVLQENLPKEIELYGGPYYKFIDLKGAKASLKNCNIQFSSPDTLNDPLECCTDLFKVKDPENFKKNFYLNKVKTTRDPLQKKKLLKNRSNFIANYNVNDSFKDLLLLQTKQIGVCSFAKHYTEDTDYLLWSHYAENHKGICIVYDFDSNPNFFKINKFKPISVNYKPKLDSYYIELEKNGYELLPWSVQKSIVWGYEDEVRFINFKLDTNSDGKYYSKINKESITKIIFGCKCSVESRDKIVEILLKNKYDLNKIRFEKMEFDLDQKLVPKEIYPSQVGN